MSQELMEKADAISEFIGAFFEKHATDGMITEKTLIDLAEALKTTFQLADSEIDQIMESIIGGEGEGYEGEMDFPWNFGEEGEFDWFGEGEDGFQF